MNRMVSLIFLCSFIFTSGCMTLRQPQNRFQDQVSIILQEQKTQTEIQHQIQDRLVELEKILQGIDKRLSATVIQRTESIPSNQTDFSTLTEPQQIKPARLMGAQKAFPDSPEKVVRDGKENSQKIEGFEQRLSNLERDLQKKNSQAKVITENKREARGIEPQKENTRKTLEKHKNMSPNDLYERALEAFSKQEYQKALILLGEMTDNFPEHKLASNAYFWQGEACYQMQDFDNATLNYSKVIEKYAESSKYPAALLKMGLSCFALNKSMEGELRLKELIIKFPDRAEAKRAGIFLNNR
jgi:tol-pal system protein YbgF